MAGLARGRVVALICITVSVGVGLAMAGRVSRRARLARTLLSVHQQTALVGLVAIAVHGITLLGDKFLSPSVGDIAHPVDERPRAAVDGARSDRRLAAPRSSG